MEYLYTLSFRLNLSMIVQNVDHTIIVEIAFPNSRVPYIFVPHPRHSSGNIEFVGLLHCFPSLHLLTDRVSQGTALGSLLFWSIIFTHKFKEPSISLKFLIIISILDFLVKLLSHRLEPKGPIKLNLAKSILNLFTPSQGLPFSIFISQLQQHDQVKI